MLIHRINDAESLLETTVKSFQFLTAPTSSTDFFHCGFCTVSENRMLINFLMIILVGQNGFVLLLIQSLSDEFFSVLIVDEDLRGLWEDATFASHDSRDEVISADYSRW
jgi:hypothetical protein